MSDYLDPNNEELLKDFFSEAEQQVETLESNVLVIENDPTNHEAIDEIFRAAHTLKGGSATVEMREISEFTHSVEDLLDEIRSDRLSVTEPVVDILLKGIDIIKAMLEARKNGTTYQENIDDIVDKLHSYIPSKSGDKKAKSGPPAGVGPSMSKPAAVAAASTSASSASADVFKRPALSDNDFDEMKAACGEGEKLWCVSVRFDEENPMNSVGGIQVFASLKNVGNILKTFPEFDALYEDNFYEFVYYFLSSVNEGSVIEDAAFLSDVTLATDALLMDNYSAYRSKVGGAAPAAAAPSQSAPAPVAAAAAPAASAPAETPAAAQAAPAQAAAKKEPAKPAAQGGQHSSAQAGSVLRVDSRRIDYLLNLVSETVITKASFNQLSIQLANELAQFQSLEAAFKERLRKLFDQLPQLLEQIQGGTSVKDVRNQIMAEYSDMSTMYDAYDADLKDVTTKFRSSTQNLGRIAGELQEGVMKIRMVPISQIFNRFPRVVRDLQRDLNKKIDLVIEGEDTELDKTVVDDLLDPIMHCVRNSVDHGVEHPEDRVAAGKTETGTVWLRASNEGNLILIEVADDGGGINVDKVRAKAVEKGVIHPDKYISDQEAYQLIFDAGFSTADKISNVSGRGVGLDVVKTMIEKLNGTIVVTSERGKGTKFSIKLPLTLAIIQGLLVRVGHEVYSIPIASVIESQRIRMSELNTIDNYEVLNVRNEVISILRLSRLFNIQNSNDSEYCFIVIVGSQEKKIGIMVDALIGEEDVVIKPLRDQFTNSPAVAGASILGDGSVSLIIDVSQLLELGIRQEITAQESSSSMYGY